MISVANSLKLARTKLRYKRGLLFTSVVAASLMFAALIACIIVFSAAEKSAESLVKRAGNDRYLVRVSPVIPDEVLLSSRNLSPKDIAEIRAFEKKYYLDLRAKYQEAGVPYDESIEIPALIPDSLKPQSLPEDQRVALNFQSPVVEAFRQKRFREYEKTAPNSLPKLRELGSTYGADGYYIEYPTTFPFIPQSHLIFDNKEDLGVQEARYGDSSTYGIVTNAVYNSYYQFVDEKLLERYLLPDTPNGPKGVPVVITAQEAVTLFGKEVGIGEEPKDASEKLKWLDNVRSKLSGYTYQVCTRNVAEQAMLSKIQRDYAEIQDNKNDSSYMPPALQYDYPDSPCGDIKTKQDNRTDDQKTADNAAIETQNKLGTYAPPEHYLTTFQIVGIASVQPFSKFDADITSYIRNLLSPQDTLRSAAIPIQRYENLPDNFKFHSETLDDNSDSLSAIVGNPNFASRVLEFPTVEKANAFLDKETCRVSNTDCHKPYRADPYGSNYLILDEIGKLFRKIINVLLPVLASLSLVIIWFTISRIMMESRRETAIYRAMGATRMDISLIYITYVMILSSLISICSLVTGISVAFVINVTYGQRLTDIALTSLGVSSNGQSFSLFDLSSPLIWLMVGMIFVVSMLASLHPLIRNVMRPPIEDMREE